MVTQIKSDVNVVVPESDLDILVLAHKCSWTSHNTHPHKIQFLFVCKIRARLAPRKDVDRRMFRLRPFD